MLTATLNIGAYHSKDVKDYASLLALPSSRILCRGRKMFCSLKLNAESVLSFA